MAVNDLITFRKGPASQWISVNPVLASGEPGYDLTNSILKIGDGVSNWVALSGHNHISSEITDFNSSVSGLLPVIDIVAGTNITVSPASGIYTINSSGSSSSLISYSDTSSFPASGVSTSYYLASDSSRFYQWTGSQYVEIGPALDTISANNITLGTLPDARLSSNIPTYPQLGARDNQPAGAIDLFPRGEGNNGGIAITSGSFILHCFTPAQSLTVSQISIGSGGVAAAGATLVQFGLYSYNETTATLLARINSDTTLFSAINTFYTRSFSTTGDYPASYTLQAGTRYGIGLLIVATTMPTLSGKGVNAVCLGLNPRLCVQAGSQSSLPTSINITSIAGAVFFGRLS